MNPAAPKEQNYALWNRRLHYFLGLYFLFFVWLFSLTGLLLNHGSWEFAKYWPNRKVSSSEQPIRAPAAAGVALEDARDFMRQLNISGEIQWLTTKPEPTQLEFRVTRPGLQFDIKADFKLGRAAVQRTEVNTWGVMHALHTFTGVRMNDTKNQRDWILTTVWALSMDAVAIGLMVMVLSGLVMWWALPAKRTWGVISLALGIVVCGWFVVGLRLFFT
jgi:hypothetical protein